MVNMAEVCEQNSGLVYHIAKRYMAACQNDRATDIEDLAQAGYIGLIEATRTYDDSKGAFSTWAVLYIQKEMRGALGLRTCRVHAEHGALSLDATLLEGEEITLADTIASPCNTEEGFDQDELVQAVRATVDALPDGQRELVRGHDLQGLSIAAAGRRIGLTSSAAQNTYRKGRDRLHRDTCLRALAEAHHLDQRTEWHRHVTLSGYRRTWTSSTEALVFWREEQQRRGGLQASAIGDEG